MWKNKLPFKPLSLFESYQFKLLRILKIFQENWIPGYGIAIGLFGEMLFYCYIGTKATIAVRITSSKLNKSAFDLRCTLPTEWTFVFHHHSIQLVHLRHAFTENDFIVASLVHERQWTVDWTISAFVSLYGNGGMELGNHRKSLIEKLSSHTITNWMHVKKY